MADTYERMEVARKRMLAVHAELDNYVSGLFLNLSSPEPTRFRDLHARALLHREEYFRLLQQSLSEKYNAASQVSN